MERANQLALDPEFYHSIRNNCTTNLAGHVNEISSKKIRYGWRVLLPGLSAKYAYDLGLLDNRIPFEELTELALVNDLALEHRDAADFSQKIRARARGASKCIFQTCQVHWRASGCYFGFASGCSILRNALAARRLRGRFRLRHLLIAIARFGLMVGRQEVFR